jgi:hypothetical protein
MENITVKLFTENNTVEHCADFVCFGDNCVFHSVPVEKLRGSQPILAPFLLRK